MRAHLLFPMLLLAACEPAPSTDAAAPPPETFACANGQSFTVRYDPAADAAHLSAGGQSYVLARAVSASGARYETDGVEFWEHQGEATLTGAAGGPYESCRAR